MMTEAEVKKLTAIVNKVVTDRQEQSRISPTWIAAEVMSLLDPTRLSPPLVALGCNLEIRQLARAILRERFEMPPDDGEAEEQHELFPGLQKRYPLPKTSRDAEPIYARLEDLSRIDVIFNVNRLRRVGAAMLVHAEKLALWGEKYRPGEAA